MKNGFSGNIAKSFLQSKLTILLMIAFLLIGAYSTFLIPREEEPQIQVPMADIFIGYPGADPKDVETKVAAPMEKMISNVKGVEYVYSTSMKGQAMLIVQFQVGEDVERSLVKLYSELMQLPDVDVTAVRKHIAIKFEISQRTVYNVVKSSVIYILLVL